MKKACILFFLLFNFLSGSYGQKAPVKVDRLDSLYKIAYKHYSNYDYKQAIENSLQLLNEAKNIQSDYYHYHAHNILGAGYQDLEDSIRAKKQYEYALVFAQRLENDTLLQWTYNNLGNIYSQNPLTVQKGIDFYNRGIDLAEDLGDENGIFTSKLNIAWTYLDNEDHKSARPYLEDALVLFGVRDDNYLSSQLNTLFGRYYAAIGDPGKAKFSYQKVIKMVEQDSLILQASEVYKHYADLLFKEQNYKEAFQALEKHNKFNSQIFENEKLRQIEATNSQFDLDQYQRELDKAETEQLYKDKLLKSSQERNFLLAISSAALFVILLLLFKMNNSRRSLISRLSDKNEELYNAKEEAERLSILKTKFFSTISHELRTPLYGVIGLTSILMEDKSLSKHEEDLKSLKFSADYLLALINDVLQMNKMESNLVKLEKVSFSLSDLLKSIMKSFEFVRVQNKNELHLQIDPEISGNLLGDPVRLSQILMNLVGNAIKFTERGNIWVRLKLLEQKDNSNRILFEIADDGPGIPENKQQLIFEEFSQLQADNYNYQGTGLGLPIVKRLLRLHNSEIILESAENAGASFRFEIVFEKAEMTDAIPQQTKEKEPVLISGHAAQHILIVDDNRINQVVTKRILEQRGFICSVSDNGAEAVEQVRTGSFDLVLMDVNMPGISGLVATRMIREFNLSIPVIALTALEIDEIRDKIQAAGMTDIIVKPYDTSIFFQVIFRNLLTGTAVV